MRVDGVDVIGANVDERHLEPALRESAPEQRAHRPRTENDDVPDVRILLVHG